MLSATWPTDRPRLALRRLPRTSTTAHPLDSRLRVRYVLLSTIIAEACETEKSQNACCMQAYMPTQSVVVRIGERCLVTCAVDKGCRDPVECPQAPAGHARWTLKGGRPSVHRHRGGFASGEELGIRPPCEVYVRAVHKRREPDSSGSPPA